MDTEDLKNRFTYHAPTGDQAQRYERLRAAALEYALIINHLCPDSDEKRLAITHLEDVVYCANASIARHT